MAALRAYEEGVMPALEVVWIPRSLHDEIAAEILVRNDRDLSLVDCAGFRVMHDRGITRALSLDAHFVTEGFEVVPDPGAVAAAVAPAEQR